MTASAKDNAYRIGEVAQRVGVTTRTIRYYEELGLLGCDAARPKGAHRVYSDADIERLRELIRLRDLLGLSLEELVELAEAEDMRAGLRNQWDNEPSDAERAKILRAAMPLVQRQLDLVHARQKTLGQFAREIESKLAEMHSLSEALEASLAGERVSAP